MAQSYQGARRDCPVLADLFSCHHPGPLGPATDTDREQYDDTDGSIAESGTITGGDTSSTSESGNSITGVYSGTTTDTSTRSINDSGTNARGRFSTTGSATTTTTDPPIR